MIWTEANDVFERYQLENMLLYLAASEGYLNSPSSNPQPSSLDLKDLLPESYTRFIQSFGYPMVLTPYCLAIHFAFLPEKALLEVSGLVGDPDNPWPETLASRKAGTHKWKYAFFCGS
jgi:hypothetical protein